jgi:hypothetical protein
MNYIMSIKKGMVKMPTSEECHMCHRVNPELRDCNPDETDDYYSDGYCVFRVEDDCDYDEDEDII